MQTVHEPIELTVVRSREDAERMREVWSRVPWTSPEPDFDYFFTVLDARPEALRPHAIFLRDEGATTAFVGRVEDITLSTSLGYRTLYAPRVRAITLVHGGVAGVDDAEQAERLLVELRSCLTAGDADVIVLPSLRTDSALYKAATALSALAARAQLESTHWALRLPPSIDEFMQSRSKKTRESLRRYRNRLLKDLGETLALRVFRDPAELELLVRDLDSVAAKTYQRGLGVAFADTPEHRALTRLGLEQGWWRVYVLYSDGEPIAFWPGTSYNGVFSIGTPGYDPAYAHYRIGNYVLLKVIEDLSGDHDVELVDFGFGEAEYKRRFGNESWTEADVVLYAPTFRAARINLTRTALEGAADAARAALTRLGVAQRLRRRSRRRLADSDEASKNAGAHSPIG